MSTSNNLAAAIKAKLEAIRKEKAEKEIQSLSTLAVQPIQSPVAEAVIEITKPASQGNEGTDRFGNAITYNAAQSEAIRLISTGESCVVIGAAGTGKTTIQKGATQALIQTGKLCRFKSQHRYLPSEGYGIAICAFTRRATNNIRKNLSADLQSSCITIHKLLEYQPVEETTIDPETGNEKTVKRFRPNRNAANPLPESLQVIIIEEASMVSVELFEEILAACPHNPQFVFLGDIQQVPPVFGSAILGYKMLELPVVELTEVYRQALESPILALAHRILSGKPIQSAELEGMNVKGKLKLHPWAKKISAEAATGTLAKFFLKALETGIYNPETDGILIPFNKSCGTDELNKHIATQIAKKEFKAVYEIIHGWKKSYYSVGDKCLFEKEDAIIKSIWENPQYAGVKAREASQDLDYWGNGGDARLADDVDSFLEMISVPEMGADEDKKTRAASHVIELHLLDSDSIVQIKSAGEIDALILGYAITIHKSQGSEWQKVFLCFHHSHATMIQREFLYTAVTRAKEELYCICEKDTFEKGVIRQRIKGSTWQEKAEFFKGKIERNEVMQ